MLLGGGCISTHRVSNAAVYRYYPLPTHGRTPHPMPSPPLRWLGLDTPSLPRRDQGNDQEGSGSCVCNRADHMVQEQQPSRQDMNVPGNLVVPGTVVSCRVVAGPARHLASVMARLDFEVLADIYQYCAYDYCAFTRFFSFLSNVILGQHSNAVLEIDLNYVLKITQ
jgi:hypothetical protein